MSKYKKAMDRQFNYPFRQIDTLLKEIKDLQRGRVIAHADGSVTKPKESNK